MDAVEQSIQPRVVDVQRPREVIVIERQPARHVDAVDQEPDLRQPGADDRRLFVGAVVRVEPYAQRGLHGLRRGVTTAVQADPLRVRQAAGILEAGIFCDLDDVRRGGAGPALRPRWRGGGHERGQGELGHGKRDGHTRPAR